MEAVQPMGRGSQLAGARCYYTIAEALVAAGAVSAVKCYALRAHCGLFH